MVTSSSWHSLSFPADCCGACIQVAVLWRAPGQFSGADACFMMPQDIQQQLEELQQSMEDSSEMAARVQQLRQNNLELDRCCTRGLQVKTR